MMLVCSTHLNLTLVHANNLLPTSEWVKPLTTLPTVLHAAVPVRVLRADLALRQPPLFARVYGTRGGVSSRAERTAHVSPFRDAATGSNVACGEAWEAGNAGDAADVPDFELLVPFCGGGAWEEDCQDGEEGEESDFEMHYRCPCCCCFFLGGFRVSKTCFLVILFFADRTSVRMRLQIRFCVSLNGWRTMG